jgi:hypothetical protein
MVEALTVMMVTSVLVRIAVPNYQDLRLRARAASVVGDFEVVKLAVFNYNADYLTWPEDLGPGVTPNVLAPYLPGGYDFDRGEYLLDWENWTLPGGLPKHPNTRRLLGISINTPDAALGQAVVDLLGSASAHYSLGETYTFVIEAM